MPFSDILLDLSKKYCEFIDAFRTNQLDSGSLNYKAIDIYKQFGSSVLDKQMPNEDIQLEKVPLFSKRLMRAFFNEYRDDIKNYLIFTFLAIIALIIILKCDNPMIKLIPAGFLAFAYFATTFVAFNSFFDRIMKDEDKAFRFGCTSQILFSLIPAILIFFGGVYYNFKTNEFYHNTESSSEINGFYGGYNTSLSDDNLNDNVEVYITASGNGSCYHINPDCISLARSKSLIKMTKKEARKKDLKPCHNCTAN